MKKVLILSASTGQGHNQAASSLDDAFREKGFQTSRHDFLEGSSKLLLSLVVGSYEVSAMKFPLAYGLFYRITNNALANKTLALFFTFVKRRLFNVIQSEKPDLIVTTHPLSICLIAGLKRMGINAPFVSIVTDFKAHYTYISHKTDLYITGSNFTKKYLISDGIKPEIIYPLGIPIKKEFFHTDPNVESLKNDDYFNILLMSGSMGLDSISLVVEELLKNKHKLRVTVICGNNKELKKNLELHLNKEFKDKKIHIIGFSKDINYFMEYSDILISKPGGLTVTESLVKDLPLVIPFVIPGQETDNARFLTSNNLSLKLDHINEVNSLIDSLIDNPDKLMELKKNINGLTSTYSIDKVVEVSSKLIK
ncbi:MAG: MGDG synthase family glycosyltransferase [Clostridium sp.]|uniref:MGDG synthase family glycosyltransferase n=1 Tax=Clostridium sp. TaxID=1506 RepID=UPI003EE7A8D0